MQALLPVHIVAGSLAIVLGGVALLAAKGGTVHRKSGIVFVVAMLTMGISGSVMALRQGFGPNIFGGLTSVYFVTTALTTVRPQSSWTRRVNLGAVVLAVSVALVEIWLGVKAFASPHFMLNGVPGPMLFFLASVTLIASIGDLRVIWSGPLRGRPRLKRHLWRMCFALFIAAGSFFSIRARVAKVLPEPFLSAPMRILPILLVFVAMFYWLWRLRTRGVVRGVPAT